MKSPVNTTSLITDNNTELNRFSRQVNIDVTTIPVVTVVLPTEVLKKRIYDYYINERFMKISEIWASCLGAILMKSGRRIAESVLNKFRGLQTMIENMYWSNVLILREINFDEGMLNYLEPLTNKSISENTREALELGFILAYHFDSVSQQVIGLLDYISLQSL